MACLTGPQLGEVKAGGGRRVALQVVCLEASAGGGFFSTQLSCCKSHQTRVGQHQPSGF